MEKFRKKKLIAVTARAPYPLNSGGRIATYNTLISLSKNYIIKLYIVTDEDLNKETITHLKNKFDFIFIYKKPKLLALIDSIRFLLLAKPMQLGYFHSNSLKKTIENENNLSSDYFIGFVLRTANYGQKFKSRRFIYSIDSMYLNYRNSVKKTKNIIWKSIYKAESLLLKKFERHVVQSFDKVSYVNPNEAKFWSKFGNVKCIPHGLYKIENDKILVSSEYKNSIIFIGRMDYRPNIIAVEWFVKNVIDFLHRDINFIIIGGNAKASLVNNLSNKRVKFVGYIKNPDSIIKSSLCSVAPMLTGGGLQTKLIKSFSLGCIVVMSRLASKPLLNFKNHHHGIISESPQEYADIINDIFLNREKYLSIKKNATQLFEKNYENSIIEKSIIKYFT